MDLKDVSGLQIDEDMAHQRRWWTIQRVARGVLYAVLGAAALGLFGHGPLAHATAGQEDSAFWVAYERFMHHSASSEVVFHVRPADGGQLSLWLGTELFDRVQVQRMVPEPESREIATDRIVYRFKAAEPGRPLAVRLSIEPNGYGPMTIRAGVPGGPELALGTIIFP